MSEQPATVQVGAYFYPLTQRCHTREERSRMLGHDELAHELDLASNVQPLFDGHDQPRTYFIEHATMRATEWDDSDEKDLRWQVHMAKLHGLSYFIFNSYRGLKRGDPVHEFLPHTLMVRNTMQTLGGIGFKYARMETLEGPRAALPIPFNKGSDYFYAEPDRAYDVTPAAARYLVKCGIKDWKSPHYLNAGDPSVMSGFSGLARPYVPFLMPNLPKEHKQRTIRDFIDAFREEAYHKYDILPYVVGVNRHQADHEVWLETDVDAVTQYLNLPLSPTELPPGQDIQPVQHYDELMEMRETEWEKLIGYHQLRPFIPSVPIGWDASPRGEPGHTWEEINKRHPYVPIVVGSTATRFAQGLQKTMNLTRERITGGERLVTIWAWNEVTEGGTLLPRRLPSGSVDRSYLEATRSCIQNTLLQKL